MTTALLEAGKALLPLVYLMAIVCAGLAILAFYGAYKYYRETKTIHSNLAIAIIFGFASYGLYVMATTIGGQLL